ncbi:S8 family serine peptidase [Mesorhizobium yinganensis]|uniref:S8 family serine peptidase n=1 Tax=Mesorhizobium yinganensis TaxID=3157707 RepID=UPI0032B83D7C
MDAKNWARGRGFAISLQGEVMTQRVNIGIEPGIEPAAIEEALRKSTTEIMRLRRDTGDVLVIDIPASADLKAFLEEVRAITGVRYAEPDSFQSGF